MKFWWPLFLAIKFTLLFLNLAKIQFCIPKCAHGGVTLLHSQCESRKVRMPEVAASAPFTLDLIRPSRLSLRRTRTFWIVESSSPSAAAIVRSKEVSHNGFNKHILPLWKILICRIFFFFTNSNSLEQSEVSARFWVGSRV